MSTESSQTSSPVSTDIDTTMTDDASIQAPLSPTAKKEGIKRQQTDEHEYRENSIIVARHSMSDSMPNESAYQEALMYHKTLIEEKVMEKDKIQEELELAQQTSRAMEAQLKASNEQATQLSNELQTIQKQLEEERLSRQQQLDAQRGEFQQVYNALAADLEKRKQEYNRMEANYYAHVRTIRATDDDLSTVQKEIGQLLGQLSNLCMSIRSKADRAAGTRYILEHWPDKETVIKEQMLKEGEDTLDVGFIGVFTERYLVEAVLGNMLKLPIHPGVRINESFEHVAEWIAKRNPQWATRLRQQVSALVVKSPLDDEDAIETAKQAIVDEIMQNLKRIYPTVDASTEKKLLAIVQRASKLNLAIKGQEIPIVMQFPKEGEASFDEASMKAASKGKSDGIVAMVISPAFAAIDPADADHGFMVSAKVLCL